MDEKDCIRRAQEGDRDAFGAIVELYQARLRAYAARYVESGDDVFDIVQDVFLNAFKSFKTFDPERELHPWLRAICMNRVRNYFRDRKKTRALPLALVDEAIEEQLPETEKETDDNIERVEALKKCISKLKENQRQIIDLRFHSRVAVNEIAEMLKKSAASISMIIMRVKTALAKCMGNQIGKA